MKVLLIGRNKIALEQLHYVSDKIFLVFDNSFKFHRAYPEFENYPIIFSDSNIASVWGIIPRVREIINWQKQYNIDVIYTNTKWDMLAAKLASFFFYKKVILLSTSHNSYAWQDEIKVRLMAFLIRLTTHYFIALSSFVYEKLIQLRLDRNNLILLPNTIGHETWSVKNDYRLHDCIRVVYVANVYKDKGQDFLIEILHKYNGRYPLFIDCYGDWQTKDDCYVSNIKARLLELHIDKQMTFRGRIENADLRSVLCDYDVYISPSRMEMSPINILEAFAAGLPVLAADVGGVADIINDGQTGMLFEADNIDDALLKFNILIENEELRKSIGQSAQNYVSSVYTNNLAGKKIKDSIMRT